MSRKLDIQWFIEQHSDWEKILSEKPYSFMISRDIMFGKKLVLLKYNQIDTQWHLAGNIAREARGIILDEDTNEVVSYAFNKFFNSSEAYADEIDAASMRSTVKIDGSIIKIRKFKDRNILISTNGTIDAYKAPVAEQIGCKFKSFGDIVEDIIVKKFGSMQLFSDNIDDNKTYVFEMVSPWTRVVTPFEENDMYLIGCRSIDPESSFSEIPFWECGLKKWFKTPEILDFSSIDKCLEHAQTLDWTDEGFVVMDKDFHRVKVKNAAWLAVHHLANNGVMSYERAIEIVRSNEVDEVVSYFPSFKDALLDVKTRYDGYVAYVKQCSENLDKWLKSNGYDKRLFLVQSGGQKRKELAIFVMSSMKDVSGFAFSYVDGKVKDAIEWLDACPAKNLCKLFGYKD